MFDSGTNNYTATVPFSTTSVTVTATAAAGTITALNETIITSGVPSPPQNLNVGENSLTITAFTETATVYTVVVTRLASDTPVITQFDVQNGTVNLSWVGSGTLKSSPDLLNWTVIPTTGNMYSASIAGKPTQFYRIHQ